MCIICVVYAPEQTINDIDSNFYISDKKFTNHVFQSKKRIKVTDRYKVFVKRYLVEN